jgi:hypothetical protein
LKSDEFANSINAIKPQLKSVKMDEYDYDKAIQSDYVYYLKIKDKKELCEQCDTILNSEAAALKKCSEIIEDL